MNYDLAKHKELRAAIVAELDGLAELPGGVWDSRVKPFGADETEYPVASVFTGNDSADYTEDEANLRREYEVQVVIISKGYDVADGESGDDSFLDLADAAQKAVENVLTQFRYTIDALVYRLKYVRSDSVIDEDGEFYTNVKIINYTAHSIEKTVGANV